MTDNLNRAQLEIQKTTYQDISKEFEERTKILKTKHKNELIQLHSENQKIVEDCKREIVEIHTKIENNEAGINQSKLLINDIIKEHSKNIKINMDRKQNKQINLLSKILQSKFIRNFWISNVPSKCDELNMVIKNNTCDQMESFTFNENSWSHKIDLEFYFDSIKVGCSKTLKRIYLDDLIMNSKQLNEVFQ